MNEPSQLPSRTACHQAASKSNDCCQVVFKHPGTEAQEKDFNCLKVSSGTLPESRIKPSFSEPGEQPLVTPTQEDNKRVSLLQGGTLRIQTQLGLVCSGKVPRTQRCADRTKLSPAIISHPALPDSYGEFLVSCLPALCSRCLKQDRLCPAKHPQNST